jgi:hypothetical protein
MFTIETDHDETLITLLDVTGELEDVSVLLYEDYVHSRQFNEKTGFFDVCTMKPEMYYKLMQAWKLPDGTYTLHKKN